MLRPGLFGRPCRGMRAQPVKGFHQLQKQEGCAWKSVLEGGLRYCVAAFNRRTSGHFGEVSEHGIFHGITV